MFTLIAGIFKNPHKAKKERLLEELEHYNDLSRTAVEIGDYDAYKAIQMQIRDKYWELLSTSMCDALVFILPHVIIMWLLSLKFRYITVFGVNIEVIIWYPSCVIVYYIVKTVVNKRRKKLIK